jgi:hypothetical protein
MRIIDCNVMSIGYTSKPHINTTVDKLMKALSPADKSGRYFVAFRHLARLLGVLIRLPADPCHSPAFARRAQRLDAWRSAGPPPDHLRIHAPRFEACACGPSAASSLVASLFPHRTTPELRHLQVKLGSKFSYKQAADILNEFLPDLSCFNHATTRNRVLAVGRKIEAETRAEIAEKPPVARPADHMIVGIDGAFVKAARTKNQRKNFEIVLGRIDSGSCSGKVFAAVRDLDDLVRERVRSALRTAGRGPATNLTVLSDGEDAMRPCHVADERARRPCNS